MSNNAKVELTGNLRKDPVVINQDGKKEFVALSIATKDSYKTEAGEWKEKEAQWHDVLLFSPQVVNPHKSVVHKPELKKKRNANIHVTSFH